MSQLSSSNSWIAKRLAPSLMPETLENIGKLLDDEEQLLQISSKLSRGTSIGICEDSQNEYIQCSQNKQGSSYRSPWSNRFQPSTDEGMLPSDTLRDLEIAANASFSEYTKLYYDNAVSSVYFIDTNPGEFACVFLIKKKIESYKQLELGEWESSHNIIVKLPPESRDVTYHYTSNAYVNFKYSQPVAGNINVSANISRQGLEKRVMDQDLFGEKHVYNMITIIETVENQLRNSLEKVYFAKPHVVLDKSRNRLPQKLNSFKFTLKES